MAEKYLCQKGYVILERNYRFRRVELDLICMSDAQSAFGGRRVLVFVEVKTRSSNGYGGPAAAVTWIKQQHMILAARSYVHQKRFHHYICRFDVVTVLNDSGVSTVNHLLDAFTVP